MSKEDFWIEYYKGHWCVFHESMDYKPLAWFQKKKQAMRFVEKELAKHGLKAE